MARVNRAVLTLEAYQDLKQGADPEISDAQIVSQWIQDELLYQSAINNDFHKDKTLVSSVDAFRRKLLGDMFLESVVKNLKPLSNGQIKKYYEENKSSFIRLVDEARIYHFTTTTKNEARQIVRALERKTSGGELKSMFIDYNVGADIIKRGFLLPELDNLIFESSSSVLGPKEIQGRYHVIEVLDRFPAGSRISLDEAYDEIYQRLIQKQIIISSKSVLDSLYIHNDIHTFLENTKP